MTRPRRVAGALREEERGMTLVEVLVVAALMIPVLSATLTGFNVFERNAHVNQRQNEAQDQVRTLMDRQANELRNLASPQDLESTDQSLDKLGGYDIIFKTVDLIKPDGSDNVRNVRRVRYCLEGGTTAPGTIHVQSQTWIQPTPLAVPPAAVPADAACPGPSDGWDSTRVVAENIVNRYGGLDRPIWSYNATDPFDVTAIREELFVDADPATAPLESKLASGVFLRNQNREPVASFGYSIAPTRRLILNGSASFDPEGKPLAFHWTLDDLEPKEGVAVTYENVSQGPHTVQLKVFDGSLSSYSTEEVEVE